MASIDRQYTWERCSKHKYGNTQLTVVTLISNYSLNNFVSSLAASGSLVETGDAWNTTNDSGIKIYWIEVFIIENYKDVFFSMLHEHNFKAV